MSAVIQLPNPINLRAGMEAVRERARSINAPTDSLRRALGVLLREMQSGRSTAASVAVANSELRAPAANVHRGYPTPPSAA